MATDTETPQKNCIPPIRRSRNADGLYTHIDYTFKPDGSVDWRKMIPTEYIVPNSERTQETDIFKLEDKDLLILLEGFQRIAEIRGYSEAKTVTVPGATDMFVAADTLITWIPNYETEGRVIARSGSADAHPGNTKSFGVNFLTTIAENRSFVRAVRRFLGIPILGKDEMGSATAGDPNGNGAPNQTAYLAALDELLTSNKIGFENFKNKMIKMGLEGADTWEKLSDVPESKVFTACEYVQKALSERRAKKDAEKVAEKS